MTQDRRYTTNNTTGRTGVSRSSGRSTGSAVRASGSAVHSTGGTGRSAGSSGRGTGSAVRASGSAVHGTGGTGRSAGSSGRGSSRTSSSSSEAARRKRAAQIKRRKKVMRNRLILAAAALIIIILIIVLAVSCGGKKKSEERRTPDAAGGSITAETGDIYSEIEKKDGDKVTTVEDTVYVRSPIEQTDREIAPSDDTDYIIRVNLAHQVTTVYRLDGAGNETPVRAFLCSTARDAHETPEGEYTLDEWYEWCYMADGTWGQYAYRMLIGDETQYMFHSVPYLEESPSSLEWADYDKLGSTASMGCVRMCVADVRWLCENIGSGVRVIVYNDPSSPGPLGKPEGYFVPWDCRQISSWDPTDPSPDNPWHSFDMSLTCDSSISVTASSEPLDITSYIRAVDSFGNDLAKYATYSCSGSDYGFYYTTTDQEKVATYPDYKQSDLVEYHYKGMDISTPGTYRIRVRLSIGPVTAYRDIEVIVS